MGDVATLLLDPHRLSRECFRAVLQGTEFRLADEVENLEDVRDALLDDSDIELVVINVRGDFAEASKCLREVRAASLEAKVVMVSEEETATALELAPAPGAEGYVLHDYSSDGLVDTLRRVRSGETVHPPAVARALEQSLRSRESAKAAAAYKKTGDGAAAQRRNSRITPLSEPEIYKVAQILVRRYGQEAEDRAAQSVKTLERTGVRTYLSDWKLILAAIQTMQTERLPDYAH